MNDPEYDIHPLDRDYSSPQPKRALRDLSSNERLRRFGIFVFGGGLAVVLMAAIALGIFRGTGWVEGFGSAMHRFGMIAILVGGVMIIASYRVPSRHVKAPLTGKKRQSSMSSFGLLLVCNVLICLLIAGLSTLLNVYRTPMLFAIFYQLLIAITCGLLVIMIVWHRGMLQAYAIGALIAMVANVFGFRYFVGMGMPRSGFSALYFGALASIPITGLACAAYVSWVFPAGQMLQDGKTSGGHRQDKDVDVHAR